MTTLKEAIDAIKSIQIIPPKKNKFADELLGKYKGVVPSGKTSTAFIRELRTTLYGKIK